MTSTYKKYTATELALAIGRRHAMVLAQFPILRRGGTGLSRAKTETDPEPFPEMAAKEFGLSRRAIFRYQGLYRGLGEDKLLLLRGTNLDTIQHLTAIKNLTSWRAREQYINARMQKLKYPKPTRFNVNV